MQIYSLGRLDSLEDYTHKEEKTEAHKGECQANIGVDQLIRTQKEHGKNQNIYKNKYKFSYHTLPSTGDSENYSKK